MKEIEILCELKENIDTACAKITAYNFVDGSKFENPEVVNIIDTYYSSSLFHDFDPDLTGRLTKSFRLRKKAKSSSITYKLDKFDADGLWKYSDEYETQISDYKAFIEIASALHLEPLVVINSSKHIYTAPNYEFVLEEVEGLGNFTEIEYKSGIDSDESEVSRIRTQMQELLVHIGLKIGPELNYGKPELMLRKLVDLKKDR